MAAAFLATDEAFFINGVCLPVDGAVSALLASPKPGKTRGAAASVASGVRSRGDGPVPPVVRIKSL